MPRYTVKQNRIKSGCLEGFEETGNTGLALKSDSMYHGIFLRAFDSGDKGSSWGKISFGVSCSENMIYCVYVLACDSKELEGGGSASDLDIYLTDKDVSCPDKIDMLKRRKAKRFVNCSDCLLYDLTGRYLYVAIEASGEGELTVSDLIIDNEGDNFMATYPEIYRERGSFFHRYLSIFSTVYNDFGRDIDDLPRLLDLDTCPKELLIIYGSWLGIDLRGGFLEEDVLRDLVREAYALNRIKGTKKAVERILEIILREPAIVVEHNQIKDKTREEIEIPKSFRNKGIYDVTILVKKHLTEEMRHQIVFILDQFKPVRTRISITQLDEAPVFDSNTYLDVNLTLPGEKGAVLDGSVLDGTVVIG